LQHLPALKPVALSAVLAIAVWAGAGLAQDTAAKPSTTPKKTTKAKAKTARKKSTAKSAAAKSTSKSTSKSSAKSTKKTATVARRSYQQQPTPQRYQEIQQALADKGYFSGTPDGAWGPSSVEALKRFQRDQGLTEDGKIGSLSLIALGLGPKRVARADPMPETKPQ
jgi:peptidoglycan hydrolase-like protein with peptidoglycan-binding domain